MSKTLTVEEFFESGSDIQKRQWKTLPMKFANEYANYLHKAKVESEIENAENDGMSRNYEEDNYDTGYLNALQKLLEQ